MRKIVIVGCGYVGIRVATRHSTRGDHVAGIVRSESGIDRLNAEGIEALRFDLDGPCPAELTDLADTLLYYFAPPPGEGDTDPRVGRMINAFDRYGHPARLVYVSTSGVYGDCQGHWIDEECPLNPQAHRSRRRLSAEDAWRLWRRKRGAGLVILRVAGIYGPGRLPLRRLREGLPLLREEQSPFTNRIQVEDLVDVCVAAMDSPNQDAVYNVSDGHPSTMVDYFCRIADLTGLPRPPLIGKEAAEQALSQGMLDYMNESRRLSNDRMLHELGISLRYPTLAQGLAASLPEIAREAPENDPRRWGPEGADSAASVAINGDPTASA
ncbi:MAG: NAD-dependent epimerase/dehydratase family protein [Gammaproteobacteria bacterium]|nr:NAD-dependent epimerase/dehydratase family protein [Gammaproteobacteria bacterium]MBU1656005.1 NAD-dependent epimerase/dehydratase family protein [Gammaproteobacteria bacterium]MBU1962213.1 NAD-dependent epimerase/dehydratase family protein [Gammaproteobacteria bacterium]